MAEAQLVFVPKDKPISYQMICRDSRFIPRYIHVHNRQELCFVSSKTAFRAFSGGNRWDVQGPALVFHRAGCYHEILSVGDGETYESHVVHFSTEDLPIPTVSLPQNDCTILPLSENEASIFGQYFNLIKHESLARQQLAVLMVLDRMLENGRHCIGGNSIDSYVFEILKAIAAQPEETPTIEQLASQFHVSPSKLKQDFSAITGMAVRQYISQQRLLLARKLLRQDNTSLTQIAYQCGYCSQSHFTAAFRARFGKTPGQYRKEHKKTCMM